MGIAMELIQGGLGNMAVFLAMLAGTLNLFNKLNLQINTRHIPTSAD